MDKTHGHVLREIATLLVVTTTLFFCNIVKASGWDERLSLYLEAYDNSAEQPKPIVYPNLSERVKNAFLMNHSNYVKIESTGFDQNLFFTELFYSDAELVVYQHDEGWNLLTKGDYVYEWRHGENQGIKIKKNEIDLVDYILYLTDPSYFMTFSTYEYYQRPENVKVRQPKGKPYLELIFKEPLGGFIDAVFVNIDSLWFHGYRLKDPKTEEFATKNISPPKEYQSLPSYIENEFNEITFTESDWTIKRHMRYL
jgi:hypothetical protein